MDDLLLDDTLDDLQRIGRYSTSTIALQRLVHLKMFTSVVQEFPFQARLLLVPSQRCLCGVSSTR